MSAMLDFKRDFVSRSKENLCNFPREHDVTDLINYSLGLIMLPFEEFENAFEKDPLWQQPYDSVPLIKEMKEIIFRPIKGISKKGVLEYYPKDLITFVRKFRNGLAHLHIEPRNGDRKWIAMRVYNVFPQTKEIDFDFELSKEQLRHFAIYIANIHLNGLKTTSTA